MRKPRLRLILSTDIDVVAKAVGELTGKTFVLDQRVKGKVNIQSAKGVAPGLAYPTFSRHCGWLVSRRWKAPAVSYAWSRRLTRRPCLRCSAVAVPVP